MNRKKYMSVIKKKRGNKGIKKILRIKKYNKPINLKKRIKYLHLMVDNIYSKIFIEFIERYFDIDEHHFLIWGWDEDGLKHVDIRKYNNIEQRRYHDTLLYCEMSDKIFIHYLTEEKAQVVNSYHKPEKFYWIFWGYDFYSRIRLELYGELTKKFIKSIGLYRGNLIPRYADDFTKAVRKIPYIMHFIEGDYKIIRENFNTKAKMLPFFYPNTIDYEELDQIDDNVDSHLNLKDKYKYVIQLGNSATQSNNHLEILYYLKKIDSRELCIVAPLSYGIKTYADELIKIGKKLFGERFIPLTNFMDSKYYFSILSQVDVAIMNHKIQQAVGNTLALLYLGKKVYINSDTTTYGFLRKLGAQVFTCDEMEKSPIEEIVKMPDEYKTINKIVVKMYFNTEKARENLSKIFMM